jgi:DNA-binding PadR family transcriptional regulator
MASTPLHEPTFLILTALAEQPRYGYDVIQEVAALSDGRVTLRAGTLYGAFDRLTEQDWIAVDREEIVDGRLRRYYRLTDGGAEVLEAESRRLRANAEAANRGLRARAKAAGAAMPAKGRPSFAPPPAPA